MNPIMRETSVAAPPSPPCQKGMRRMAAVALSLLLVGCGQKGPLTPPPAANAASAPGATR